MKAELAMAILVLTEELEVDQPGLGLVGRRGARHRGAALELDGEVSGGGLSGDLGHLVEGVDEYRQPGKQS
jgi:hypothetical protein